MAKEVRMMAIAIALASFAVGGQFVVSPAFAQPAASPAGQSTNADEQALDQIVVTAQRRSELQRDVPISITTISAEQLTQADVTDLSEIQKLTPALTFDYPNGPFVQPTIRGIGTAIASPGSGSNVGVYIDGFYSPNPLVSDFQLLNTRDIQVLKGPQGTLFGRNTTGGAILITTADPSTTPSATAEASYGNYYMQRYQTYATTGLTDKIAVDIEGLYRKGDGFVHNVVTGREDGQYEIWTIRTGVKADVSDAVSLLFRYTHDDVNDPTTVAGNIYAGPNGQIYSIGVITPGAVIVTRPDQVSNDGPTSVRTYSDAFQLTSTFEFNFAALTSHTQYRRDTTTEYADFDHTSAPIFDLYLLIPDKTLTQEFLLTSKNKGPLQWTAGTFFYSYTDTYPNTGGSFGGAPFFYFAHSSVNDVSYAAFLDVTYEVVNNLFLTAGARFSHDEVKNAFFGSNPIVQVPSIDSNHGSPRAVIRYKPNEESSVYASFTRGYKPAILNVGGGTLNGIYVAPETISAYEVGYKYGAHAFAFDLSSFYYDYKNLQVASYTGTTSLINNAATSRIYGLEGQLQYEIVSGLNLTAGAAYVDAKYTTFTTSPRYDQCLVVATCGASYGLYAISDEDASGNQMQNSPKSTGNVGLRYATDVAAGQMALSGNYYYTSQFFFDPSNQFVQKGYQLLSLRAAWTDPSKKYTFAVFGDNVTNTRYRTQVLAQPYGVGSVWGPPATIGCSVRARF